MMGLMPAITPAMKELALTDNASNGASLTTYTFSNANLGKPAPGRLIVVVVATLCGSSVRTLTGITVGGVSATIHVNLANSGNSNNCIATIGSVALPAGATGDVVVNYTGGSSSDCHIAVYRANNLSSLTVFDASPKNNDDNQFSMLIDVPPRGMVVAVASRLAANNTVWSAGASEDWDTGSGQSSASRKGLAAATGYAITCNDGGSPSRYACISFG